MATINPVGTWIAKGVHKVTWDAITASTDTITAYAAGGRMPERTVYVTGTWNSGVVGLAKSDNTATGPFIAMVDPQGNAISFSAANDQEALLENAQFIKPTVSSTTGATTVNVIMIERAP